MKNIIFKLLLLGLITLFSNTVFSQGAGVRNVNVNPSGTPTTSQPVIWYNRTTGTYFKYSHTLSTWLKLDEVAVISGCVPPAYVPTSSDEKIARNNCGEIFAWDAVNSAWTSQFDTVEVDYGLMGSGTIGDPFKVDTTNIATINDVSEVYDSLQKLDRCLVNVNGSFALGERIAFTTAGSPFAVTNDSSQHVGVIVEGSGTTWKAVTCDGQLFVFPNGTFPTGIKWLYSQEGSALSTETVGPIVTGWHSGDSVWFYIQPDRIAAGGGDDWGNQTAKTDSTLSGSGTTLAPLAVVESFARTSNRKSMHVIAEVGQSNACGLVPVASLTADESATYGNVLTVNGSTIEPLTVSNAQGVSAGQVGLETFLKPLLAKAYPRDTFIFIKECASNTGAGYWSFAGTGYRDWTLKFHTVIDFLRNSGRNADMGMLYLQGEAEIGTAADLRSALARYTRVVNDYRRLVPNLPFFINHISTADPATGVDRAKVNDAFNALQNTTDFVYLSRSTDYAVIDEIPDPDVHFSAEGYRKIARDHFLHFQDAQFVPISKDDYLTKHFGMGNGDLGEVVADTLITFENVTNARTIPSTFEELSGRYEITSVAPIGKFRFLDRAPRIMHGLPAGGVVRVKLPVKMQDATIDYQLHVTGSSNSTCGFIMRADVGLSNAYGYGVQHIFSGTTPFTHTVEIRHYNGYGNATTVASFSASAAITGTDYNFRIDLKGHQIRVFSNVSGTMTLIGSYTFNTLGDRLYNGNLFYSSGNTIGAGGNVYLDNLSIKI